MLGCQKLSNGPVHFFNGNRRAGIRDAAFQLQDGPKRAPDAKLAVLLGYKHDAVAGLDAKRFPQCHRKRDLPLNVTFALYMGWEDVLSRSNLALLFHIFLTFGTSHYRLSITVRTRCEDNTRNGRFNLRCRHLANLARP